MKNRIENRYFMAWTFRALGIVLFTLVVSSHAFAQHWTNYHQTIHCTVNVEQTFLGHWRVVSLNYTAANDSGTSLVYKCISCNDSSAHCSQWAGFNCTVQRNQGGHGSFSGKNSVLATFLPLVATQQNSCEEVYQKADIVLR